MKNKLALTLPYSLLLTSVAAQATQFMKTEDALMKALGSKKVFKKKYPVDGKEAELYYTKSDDGKPTRFAAVQSGTYAPDCTHTWVVQMKANPVEVEKIHVVEMKCPHAFPTKSEGFLGQFEGKKVADIKTLDGDIAPVGKATGSSVLTTKAVVRSLKLASQFKP